MGNTLETYGNYSREALLELLGDQAKSNSKLKVDNSKLESKATKLTEEVIDLKFQIDQLRRAMFGSKRERFIAAENPEQLLLPFDIDAQKVAQAVEAAVEEVTCLLYTSPSPRDRTRSRMPSS